MFFFPVSGSQNVCNNMCFLSVNTEGQGPTFPTIKNQKEKFIRAARLKNCLCNVYDILFFS